MTKIETARETESDSCTWTRTKDTLWIYEATDIKQWDDFSKFMQRCRHRNKKILQIEELFILAHFSGQDG